MGKNTFEFSEQCLSKSLPWFCKIMSCRMPKYCWGDRFWEENGNCGLFFCRRSNLRLVWGTLTFETRLNFSRMSCLFLTVLEGTCSQKDLNRVAELDCPKTAVVTVRPGRDQPLLSLVIVHARMHAHREHADLPSTSGKSFCLSRQTPSTCPNTEKK